MGIAVVGTGYVGLPQGAVFADVGNRVVCVDWLKEKIDAIINFCEGRTDKLPIHEKGLNNLVLRNYREGKLSFTTDLDGAVRESDVIFICVGTPSKDDGSVNTSYVMEAAEKIAKAMNYSAGIHKTIIIKSTVPPGTASNAGKRIKELTDNDFDIVSNPEFLAQGYAVSGSQKPDRIVVGLPKARLLGISKGDSKSLRVFNMMKKIYSPFEMRGDDKIFFMTNEDAELHKYIANTYLATQIAVTNEAATLAKKSGANWRRLSAPFKKDSRIGTFTHPSLGFGGSCFPKDVKALTKIFEEHGISPLVIGNVIPSNENQKLSLNRIVENAYGLEDKTYCIWGLSFKARTNDTRESAAIDIIADLLKKGAKIKAYDPKAVEDMKLKLDEKEDIKDLVCNIEYFSPYDNKTKYDALKDCDGLFVLTEWMEFRQPDFIEIKKLLKRPLVIDGRDLYNPEEMEELGFDYISVGNPDVVQK